MILFCLDLSLTHLHISENFSNGKGILLFLAPPKTLPVCLFPSSALLPGRSLAGHWVLSKMSTNIFGPHQIALNTWSCQKRPHLENIPRFKEPILFISTFGLQN